MYPVNHVKGGKMVGIVPVHYACAHACTWTIKIAVFFHKSSLKILFIFFWWEAACSFFVIPKAVKQSTMHVLYIKFVCPLTIKLSLSPFICFVIHIRGTLEETL